MLSLFATDPEEFYFFVIFLMGTASSNPFISSFLALFVLPVGQNKAAKQLRDSTRGSKWLSEPFKMVICFFFAWA